MQGNVILASCLSVLFLCVPAGAVPTPMLAEQLHEQSDVVAKVQVIAVTCTDSVRAPDGERQRFYQARLRVLEPSKGNVRAGEVILVEWHDVPARVLGPWTVAYYVGETATTHLIKTATKGVFTTLWWNAKDRHTKPVVTVLPRDAGETIALAEASESGRRRFCPRIGGRR